MPKGLKRKPEPGEERQRPTLTNHYLRNYFFTLSKSHRKINIKNQKCNF